MVRASSATRLAAMLLLLSIVLGVRAAADDQPRPAPFNATAANPPQDDAVEQLLDQTVTVDFRDEPLDELIAFLADHKINAILDTRALEEAGIGSDVPLRTLEVSEISLRSVMDLLLHPIDSAHVIREGKLVITTTEVAEQQSVIRIYRVEDLVRSRTDDGEQYDDFDSLIETITTTVRPATWEERGGPGTICEYQGALVIGQTQQIQHEIARLLAALRESRAKQQSGAPPEPIWTDSPANGAARRKFADKSSAQFDFQFVEQPLEEVVAVVAQRFGLQAVLDLRALEEAGIGVDMPVTADLRKVTLPAALAFLLRPYDMTYVIEDEVVLVTTIEVAEQEISIVVYPVADLVQYGEPRVGARRQDFDRLIETITTSVMPDTWGEVGGPGWIAELPITSSLVVSQTQPVQQKLARLMTGLRKLRAPLASPPRRVKAGGMGGGGGKSTKLGGGMF